MPKFETLIGSLSLTECPRWRDGRLYFSDFYTQRVLAVALDGTLETIAEVPAQPSDLGFLPDGRMLIVSMRDRRSCVANAILLSLSTPTCRALPPAFERHGCRSSGASLGSAISDSI